MQNSTVKYPKWIGLLGILLIVIACFVPWVYIKSKQLIISGFYTIGTHFGKPGILHIFLASIATIAFCINKLWAKRTNILICAIHIAVAIKNYILITSCFAGECPEKKIGIFLIIIGSVIMMLAALFSDAPIKNN